MSFVWDHYLDIAESLWKQGLNAKDGEGLFRCAISRAYYAAFHESLVYLKDPGLQHRDVVQVLSSRNSRKDKSLLTWFKLMKYNRKVADYDISFQILAEDAEKVIESARKFIKLAR